MLLTLPSWQLLHELLSKAIRPACMSEAALAGRATDMATKAINLLILFVIASLL